MVVIDRTRLRSVAILQEMRRIAANGSVPLAFFVVALALCSVAVEYADLSSDDYFRRVLLVQAGIISAEYFLLIALMRRSGLMQENNRRGFGEYALQLLIKCIAMTFGAVLLVIPALIFAILWLPSYAYMFGQGLNTVPALDRSWNQTAPHFLSAVGAAIVPLTIYGLGWILPNALYDVPAFSSDLAYFVVLLVSDAMFMAAYALWTLLGIAVYSLIEGGKHAHQTAVPDESSLTN